MDIEIICTGDEVLSGQTVNSNFSYLARTLADFGFEVSRGITVGDDHDELLRAFRDAGARADVVIVNGGLGPTVDDLSQEIAAEAAGVDLELNEDWLTRMDTFFRSRRRGMPANNRKQAMLPAGSELVDNPIGTACGFALTIGRARFYFTPGVPRELFRMTEQEIVPRLRALRDDNDVIVLRRFHSYGLGESHVDELLRGLTDLAPDGRVRLGFRTHYPQLETKLTVRAPDAATARASLAPVEKALYARIGHFILAEDDDTVEDVIGRTLREQGATLAVVEDFTGGQVTARLTHTARAGDFLRMGIVAFDKNARQAALDDGDAGETRAGTDLAETLARRARSRAGATHGLATVCEGPGTTSAPGASTDAARSAEITVSIAIVTATGAFHRSSRLTGNARWNRLGAVEMTLDCLRRQLAGLPVDEKTDFEK